MDLLRRLAVGQEAVIIAVTHDEKIFDRIVQLRGSWNLVNSGFLLDAVDHWQSWSQSTGLRGVEWQPINQFLGRGS
jgi:hypothetical protein